MAKARQKEGRILSALAELNPGQFRSKIRRALKKNDGVVSRAAEDLGIGTRQLWRWLKRDPSILEGIEHRRNTAKIVEVNPAKTEANQETIAT